MMLKETVCKILFDDGPLGCLIVDRYLDGTVQIIAYEDKTATILIDTLTMKKS